MKQSGMVKSMCTVQFDNLQPRKRTSSQRGSLISHILWCTHVGNWKIIEDKYAPDYYCGEIPAMHSGHCVEK